MESRIIKCRQNTTQHIIQKRNNDNDMSTDIHYDDRLHVCVYE